MTGGTVSHYRILEKLGERGMGVVYKALDSSRAANRSGNSERRPGFSVSFEVAFQSSCTKKPHEVDY